MIRPYLVRRPGDPLVAWDHNEVQRRHAAELDVHDHTGGSRGALLGGASFDRDSELTVRHISAQRLAVGGEDVDAVLARSLPVAGGTLLGDLEVLGALRVGGRLEVSPDPRVAGSAANSAQVHNSEVASETYRDLAAEDLARVSGQSISDPELRSARLQELPDAAVTLELRAPSVLIVQLVASYEGPIGGIGANLHWPQLLPLVEVVADRGGPKVALGGPWRDPPSDVDPSDIDALLASQAAWRAPDFTGIGGGLDAQGGIVSPEQVVVGNGTMPVLRTWVCRAGAGSLRLRALAWGIGHFAGVSLSVTSLPEALDV